MGRCGPVLIVDDDASNRELLSCLLEGSGIEVLEATSGESALVLAGEQRPALVVLDVRLPGVSGYEVCRDLRERFGHQLPILFLSGAKKDPDDRVAGLLIGGDDYVTKPFFPDELVARIRRLLARTNGREPGHETEEQETAGLTRREQEVLVLLAEGLSQEAIAERLVISSKTVATHLQHILRKLRVHSRAAAVSRAYQLGLVQVEVEPHLFFLGEPTPA